MSFRNGKPNEGFMATFGNRSRRFRLLNFVGCSLRILRAHSRFIADYIFSSAIERSFVLSRDHAIEGKISWWGPALAESAATA